MGTNLPFRAEGEMFVKIVGIKWIFVIAGAAFAVIGILTIDARRQAEERERARIEDAIRQEHNVLDRMSDFRRQYLQAIEMVPILMFAVPSKLQGREGRAAAEIFVDRVSLMVRLSCASSDSRLVESSVVEHHCSAAPDARWNPEAADVLRTRSDLVLYRFHHGLKHTNSSNLRYFNERRRVESVIARLDCDLTEKRAEVDRLEAWQNIFAVFGILIALGKDLVGGSEAKMSPAAG
jgi:hypothetical protein